MLAVVGVGAIGGLCAAHLLAAGRDVACCVRRPFEELALDAPGAELRMRPRVETDPGAVGPCDWVLMATKAHQTEGASGWLEALVARDTRVAVLQNGVEHVERLSHWVPRARILPVVVACPATASAPGRIVQRSWASLTVPDGAAGRAFAALFEDSDVDLHLTPDFQTAAWRKLCINVTGGALAALAGVALPQISHPRTAQLARALAHECAEVARAEGADVPAAFADRIAARAAGADSGGSPSTLTDRRCGRPLEADARNGAVVRFGRRHGIATPLNARAAELMAGLHLDRETDLLPALAEALPPP